MVARVQASQGGASSPINALRVPRAMPAVLHGRGEVASVPHPPVRAGLRKGRSLSRAAGRDQAVAARRKRSSCEVRNFGASSETPLPAPPQERGEAFFKSVATAEKAKEAESKPTTKDGPATASAKPAHHRMYSVMIRVYENRLVQVSMRNPPTENCRDHAKTMPVQAPASSPSSASAARALALSAVLASVTAWVPPARSFQRPVGLMSLWSASWSASSLSMCKRRIGYGMHAARNLPGLPGSSSCSECGASRARAGRSEKRQTTAGLAVVLGLYEAIYTLTR